MLLSLQPFWVPLEGGCSKAAMDGPDGTGKGDEIGGEAATPVDSSGTRARDKGPKTRDQGPRQSHCDQASRTGPTQWLSVAEGVDRWAEKLNVALTRSIEDQHRHCPR